MRLRVRYLGRVQGVGFRATCREFAAQADVTGWVQNEADGGVLMEIQGEEREVRRVMEQVARTMERNIDSVDEASVAEVRGERLFGIAY